jgi:hypothetical protein
VISTSLTSLPRAELFELALDSFGHAVELVNRVSKRSFSRREQGDVFAPATAARRRRVPDTRLDQPLLFEPPERHVDRADRQVATRALLDFAPNHRAVRAVAETQQREQYQLLKIAERVYLFHAVDYIRRRAVLGFNRE